MRCGLPVPLSLPEHHDKPVRRRNASFLRWEPGTLPVEPARTIAFRGVWGNVVPHCRASSTLHGATRSLARNSCRALRRPLRLAFAFRLAARVYVPLPGGNSPPSCGRPIRAADRAGRVPAGAFARGTAGEGAPGAGAVVRISCDAEYSGVLGLRDFVRAQHYFPLAGPAATRPQAGRGRLALSGA